MKAGTQAYKVFDSRKDSLRFQCMQQVDPLPSYMTTPSQDQEEEKKTTSDSSLSVSKNSLSQVTFTMHTSSFSMIIFMLAVVSILLFTSGFLTSYLLFKEPQGGIGSQSPPIAKLQQEPMTSSQAEEGTPEQLSLTQTLQDAQNIFLETANEEATEENSEADKIINLIPKDDSQPKEVNQDSPLPVQKKQAYAIGYGISDTDLSARNMLKELEKSGIEATIVLESAKDGRTLYHIRSKTFPTYQQAQQEIRKSHLKGGKVVRIEIKTGDNHDSH